jgi:hypothetical protein
MGGQFGIPCAIHVAMPLSKFMKFRASAVVFAATAVLVAGCNSLDNPLGGLFHTGDDARVFNSQTGQWEWPPEKRTPRPKTTPTPAPITTPVPERQSEGRYYDPQKNQWVEADKPGTEKSKKPSAAPVTLKATPAPVGTPQPVRSARARGVYNPSTGQIEWTDFDPAPAATPAPQKKKWYWPF